MRNITTQWEYRGYQASHSPVMEKNIQTLDGQVSSTAKLPVKDTKAEFITMATNTITSRMTCHVPISSAVRGSGRRVT